MHDNAERVIAAAEAEDVQTVETELKVFLNQFAKHKKMLGAFVNHGELDEADILVRGLQDKAKEEAYDELSDDMRELQYHFAHLRDTETPRFENIFWKKHNKTPTLLKSKVGVLLRNAHQ